MKIAIIFSICIHSVFYFAMVGSFFPDFKKNNKNLELHSTSISIIDLPSYDAMISNEPILKSSNYEILNSNFYGFFYFVGLPLIIILPMTQRHIIMFLLDKGKITCQPAMISVMFCL